MVMFYNEYSTKAFTTIVNKYLDAEFVQPVAAQIEDMFKVQINQRNSPLLNYPVADSTLSTIINHTKKLLHTYLHLLVRIQTKKWHPSAFSHTKSFFNEKSIIVSFFAGNIIVYY